MTAPDNHLHEFLAPSRRTATIITPSLAPAAHATGTIALAPGYRILSITADKAARVRIYSTTAKRDADLARPLATPPTGDAGVLLDLDMSTDQGQELSPAVDGYTVSGAGDAAPYTITNMGSAAVAVTAVLTWLPTEGA